MAMLGVRTQMAMRAGPGMITGPGGIRYQGDPGIFGDILGGISKVAGVVSHTGIPIVSSVAGEVSKLTAQTPSPQAIQQAIQAKSGVTQLTGGRLGIGGGLPLSISAGGASTMIPPSQPGTAVVASPKGNVVLHGRAKALAAHAIPGHLTVDTSLALHPPRGTHPNKSGYFRLLGGGHVEYIPAGTRAVKNRRMNPLNYRAATRAIRRIKAAQKAIKKIERALPAKPHPSERHGRGCRCASCRRR